MNEIVESKPSSIFPADEQPTKNTQHEMFPTYVLLIFLVVVFFVLKSFIYTKDKKRHGA